MPILSVKVSVTKFSCAPHKYGDADGTCKLSLDPFCGNNNQECKFTQGFLFLMVGYVVFLYAVSKCFELFTEC